MGPPTGALVVVKQVVNLCFIKSPDAFADFIDLLHVLVANEAPPLFAPKTGFSEVNVMFSETSLAKSKQPEAMSADLPLNAHQTKTTA